MRIIHRARALPLATLLFAAAGFGSIGPAAIAAPVNSPSGQNGLTSITAPPAPEKNPIRRLTELRSKLDSKDQIVALRALHLALSQVPDGGTFVWQKKSRSLKGMIKPNKAFRNADGQVCRHVIYALALGGYSKQIEGIACRLGDGRWQL